MTEDKKLKRILFITTDQQRRDSLPCYGLPFMKTPALESLARRGVVFDNAISAAPQCQPCRASFLVGQHPSVTGVPANFHWVSKESPTIAQAFSRAGWKTAAIGKMHFDPWDDPHGFSHRIIAEDKRHFFRPDHHARFLEGRGIERWHPGATPGYGPSLGAYPSPLPEELHIDSFIADAAVDYLEGLGEENFFCWVSFNSPHDPYDPPEDFAGTYRDAPVPEPVGSLDELDRKPGYQRKIIEFFKNNPLYCHDFSRADAKAWRRIREHYLGSVSFIDGLIGRILGVLERKGILEETLVVFSSDHGDHLGDHGLPYKGTFYQGSIGVPLIVAGPGAAAGGRSRAFADWVDLHRSFLSMAGLEVPAHVQGEDLSPFLADPELPGRDLAFSELDGKIMAFDGRFKLVVCDDGEGELYDLETDPGELKNRFGDRQCRDAGCRLSQGLARHLAANNRVRRFGGGRVASDPGRDQAFARIKSEIRSGSLAGLAE